MTARILFPTQALGARICGEGSEILNIETYFVSSATTNACNQIHPESATMDASSISLFSKAYACMVMTKTTIACKKHIQSLWLYIKTLYHRLLEPDYIGHNQLVSEIFQDCKSNAKKE